MCQVAFLFSSSTSYLKKFYITVHEFFHCLVIRGEGGVTPMTDNVKVERYHFTFFFAFQVCTGWN